MKKYYIVGNRAFDTFGQATDYCEENDFDGETMITEVSDGERVVNYYDKTTNHNVGYVDTTVNLKKVYIIEYITDKRDYERVCSGRHDAPWELYKTYKTEDLQQAITVFLAHYASARTYDVKLFEEIYINGELIREECINYIMNFTRICDDNKKRLADVLISRDETIEALADELETVKEGLAKFGKDAYNKFIREQREQKGA